MRADPHDLYKSRKQDSAGTGHDPLCAFNQQISLDCTGQGQIGIVKSSGVQGETNLSFSPSATPELLLVWGKETILPIHDHSCSLTWQDLLIPASGVPDITFSTSLPAHSSILPCVSPERRWSR